MSLRLLIDEDSQDKRLVKLLRDAGHDVLTVNEAGMMGQPDDVVLTYANHANRLVLTFNCNDFQALHDAKNEHSGILVVYQNEEYSKNMSFRAIIKAIAKLEASMILLANQFFSLNQWNY